MAASGNFRFEIGETVRVVTHPARPRGTILARLTGAEARDPYGENVYVVSTFVTKQRESSLAPEPAEEGREELAESAPLRRVLVG